MALSHEQHHCMFGCFILTEDSFASWPQLVSILSFIQPENLQNASSYLIKASARAICVQLIEGLWLNGNVPGVNL